MTRKKLFSAYVRCNKRYIIHRGMKSLQENDLYLGGLLNNYKLDRLNKQIEKDERLLQKLLLKLESMM